MKRRCTVVWDGRKFTTLCTFQGRRLTQFACLYLIETEEGPVLKKRLWREGVLVSSSLLARCGGEWVWLFEAARASFVAQAKNGEVSPSRSTTHAPLTPHVPHLGELVTTTWTLRSRACLRWKERALRP